DHAGEGEPGHPRSRDAGLGAGDRERRRYHRRGNAGALRSERLRPASRPSRRFGEKCVEGIEANREACERYAELTLSAATALNPYVGYDKASEIVKEAAASGRSLREGARENGGEDGVLDEALDYRAMTRPHERG